MMNRIPRSISRNYPFAIKGIARLCSGHLGHHTPELRIQLAMMFAIDLAIVGFFLAGPYLHDRMSYVVVNYAVVLWITAELVARWAATSSHRRFLSTPMNWLDFLILGTLLFPQYLSSFAFLRVARIWSIVQRPVFALLLRRFGLRERVDVVIAFINLVVFLFLVTGFVYTFFFHREDIGIGFIDALYFTVTTMTTTGFGDVTLPGTAGKLTSIVTMIIGISLFVRLAQALVRPPKVTFDCAVCGLQRHDADAVHCKACGHTINIPDEGI